MNDVEQLTFEEAFAKLEEVVRKLEMGGLSLEESLALYEQGRLLAAYCTRKLEEAELKVQQLLPDGTLAPFEVD